MTSVGFEKGRLRERRKSETRNMGKIGKMASR
jgi:hypothetical protein